MLCHLWRLISNWHSYITQAQEVKRGSGCEKVLRWEMLEIEKDSADRVKSSTLQASAISPSLR
jgi:hypothetical protein